MAKIHGTIDGNLYPRLKTTLDIYWDKQRGLIARTWPRYNAPANTAAWQSTQRNLESSWHVIKSLPIPFRERYQKLSDQNSTRTLQDMLRSCIMAAQDNEYYVANITNTYVYWSSILGSWILELDIDDTYAKGDPANVQPPRIIYATQQPPLIPIWRRYPSPIPSLCKSYGKMFPLWPKQPAIAQPSPIITGDQSGITSPDTHGWQHYETSKSGQRTQIDFLVEDSKSCGGSNDNIQSGNAHIDITLTETATLTAYVDAIVETQNPGYDDFWIEADDQYLAGVKSTESGGECTTENKTDHANRSLGPGEHTITMRANTGDARWHNGVRGSYKLQLSKAPTLTPTYILRNLSEQTPYFSVLPITTDAQGRPRLLSGPHTLTTT